MGNESREKRNANAPNPHWSLGHLLCLSGLFGNHSPWILLKMKRALLLIILGTIGINWDCPRQVRTNGHSVNHQKGKTVVRFSRLLSCDKWELLEVGRRHLRYEVRHREFYQCLCFPFCLMPSNEKVSLKEGDTLVNIVITHIHSCRF